MTFHIAMLIMLAATLALAVAAYQLDRGYKSDVKALTEHADRYLARKRGHFRP
ncbi:hypothetical protein LCL99_04035 [Halomonas denitrificans]|uniref:hypothetical protein n=1 Tax=Halomonas TaxID=2745 RepID=UPI001A8F2B79|nr:MULTISPECIES: hypothetical protein [Halomonas]MED5294497.1 hypothetical protein [Pseudomonadota bacterium]MBN8411269.1 hypothetical protein [Halomonas litopenaei]MBY5925895.1 hypothetical protein [Halomonas sp. DP4Y7-2]MBY5927627.1 hypothetical protein [Halomonas sp. DP8Y7-3]MBY5969712.1 hypothetical protein [Halomonas denitrificans]